MRKIYLLIILLGSLSSAFSQSDCDCEQALKQLIQKVEKEYPGFGDKTKDSIAYANYKESFLVKARGVENFDCVNILKMYLRYFKDGHISLFEANAPKKENKIDISNDEFQRRISETKDPLEGIWKSGLYKVGIIKLNDDYRGFIMNADTNFWKPGEIKFRLFDNGKADYFFRDHTLSVESYELVDNWILYFNSARYVKEFPKPDLTDNEIKAKIEELDGFYFKRLTDKTSLLCISSFEHNYVERINKLLEDKKDSIQNSEYLIIDVRNNLGGVYAGYEKLFPYLLTNELRGMNIEFLATPTLIDEFPKWYEGKKEKEEALELTKVFKEKIGKFVNPDTVTYYINYIKPAEKSPKEVVILVNRRTASSGEAFVLDARQSKKVKILGTPTYGVLDYGSASFFDFGCGNYKLMMPTWRTMRLPEYPIDNIGIQPDIYLDKSVKDWVKFAINYLENKSSKN